MKAIEGATIVFQYSDYDVTAGTEYVLVRGADGELHVIDDVKDENNIAVEEIPFDVVKGPPAKWVFVDEYDFDVDDIRCQVKVMRENETMREANESDPVDPRSIIWFGCINPVVAYKIHLEDLPKTLTVEQLALLVEGEDFEVEFDSYGEIISAKWSKGDEWE